MDKYVVKDIYKTDDRVQAGSYACTVCKGTDPAVCVIAEDGHALPMCPVCGSTYWIKF